MTDSDVDEFIESHIKYIRKMNLLTDDQLRYIFRSKIIEDPTIIEKFKEKKIKKQYDDIIKISKDIKTSPLKIGRKVA